MRNNYIRTDIRSDIMKGWKTIIFNVGSFLIFALGYEPLANLVSPQILGLIITGLNVGLRMITSSPVGWKK